MNQQVAETLRKLYLAKRTGVLMCEVGEDKRGIFFASGFVVRARSSREEDRLGEVMVRHGRIDAQQFEDASLFIKSGWKLGEILAELKIIEKEEIERYLRIQLLDICCSLLIHPPRRLAFSNLSEVEPMVANPVSVADVLMDAARRTPHVDRYRDALMNDDRRLGFSSNPLLRFQEVNLAPEEAYILSRIDGNEPARAIFAVSPLSEEQTARCLLGLLHAGIIEPEGEPGYAAEQSRRESPSERPSPPRDPDDEEIERVFAELPTQDHWQVLGLSRGAGRDQVKQAFFERARRYHPDRFRRNQDPEFQEKVSHVFHRVSEAYQTLSSERAADYEKLAEKEQQYEQQRKSWGDPSSSDLSPLARTRHPAEAKALFLQAKRAYQEQDFWKAIQLCQQAIEIVGDQAEYYYLLGMALAENPKWRQDAERNLKIATNLDPWKAEYFAALGRIYRKAGMNLRAQKAFEQARAVDPTFEEGEE